LDIPAAGDRFTFLPVFPVPDQILFDVDPIGVGLIRVRRSENPTTTGENRIVKKRVVPSLDTYTLIAHADQSGIIRRRQPRRTRSAGSEACVARDGPSMNQRPSPTPSVRLCLGGSFDPIHYGHILCARFAAEQSGLAGVRILPAARSPHKAADADLADAGRRLRVIRAALAADPFFLIDDRELRRPPPSYTLQTVQSLLADGHPAPVPWLIGADHLPRLHTWFGFDELIKLTRFIVMRRPGHAIETETLDPRVKPLVETGLIDIPQIDISSTLIRQRLRAGLPITHLMPPAAERAYRAGVVDAAGA
jgi:nicotinate-nucleotide adenylyltransferase